MDRPVLDFLSGTLNNTDVTSAFTVTDGSALNVDGIADFDDGTFESCFVSAKATLTTGTFQRGWESTTATHASAARIRVNPRYRAYQYREAVNMALSAIGAGFRRNVWDSTQSFSSTVRLITVPAAAVQLIEVMMEPTGTPEFSRVPARLTTAPTAVVSTGKAAQLIGRNPGTGTAYIHYQDAWPTLTATSDTLDPDYPTDAEDLVLLGAECWLLDSDGFSLVAFQEPHVTQRQFGSKQGDVDSSWTRKMQRFITRRTEVASTRPQKSPTWLRGV